MDFCVECGHKKENNEQIFCVNCGASLSKKPKQELKDIQSNHDVTRSSSPELIKVKKEMTKKQKKRLAMGSVILIAFIGLYFIGDYFTSESRLISKYSNAISEQDAVKLGEIISYSNSDKKIGEEHAMALLSLLEDNQGEQQRIIEDLEIQSNRYGHAAANEWSTEDYLISLAKGDGFLFYDTYELVMEPIYVTLHTNVKDATLFVGDEEVIISDSTDFFYEHGPIITGNYVFRAEVNNEYVDLETITEATITKWEDLDLIYLTMDATYIEFEVEDLGKIDARLLIDDEVVEFNFLEENEFGPIIAEETKVSAEVDFPWGTMVSEPDYPYQNYQLNFSLSEEMQADVAQAIEVFHKNYWEGWQKNSTSEFAYLPEDLLNNIKSDFSNDHSDGYTFERQSVLAEIDTQNIVISYDDGDYLLFVNMIEEYKEDNYYDADFKELWDQTDYYQVELRYDDGWKVYELQDSYEDIDDPLKLEVSDELYVVNGKNPHGENAGPDSDNGVEESVLNYIEYLVDAINAGNYELVEPYIKDGSPLHDMQLDLVSRLFKNGTTQEVVSASVEQVSDNGTDWTVTTNETIKIIYESGKEDTKEYVWNYTVEADDGEFVLINIESVD